MKFKVGDLVRAKKEIKGIYFLTTHNSICKVIEITSKEKMRVKLLNCIELAWIGSDWPVFKEHFEKIGG